jgi:hypothetical protein
MVSRRLVDATGVAAMVLHDYDAERAAAFLGRDLERVSRDLESVEADLLTKDDKKRKLTLEQLRKQKQALEWARDGIERGDYTETRAQQIEADNLAEFKRKQQRPPKRRRTT